MNEHALIDLPAILGGCRERFGFERVALLGHSLGGAIWLQFLLASNAMVAAPTLPAVVASVALACPGALDQHTPPWSEIANRGRQFIDSLDRNHDGAVNRGEFSIGQISLRWPWVRKFASSAAVEAILTAGGRSPLLAGLIRRLPLPVLVYSADDFTDSIFRWVLRSKTIDRASHRLFIELYERIVAGPPILPPPPPLIGVPLLAIGSAADKLVPLSEVIAFARHFSVQTVLSTEQAFGLASGHAGYFFKEKLRDVVYEEVRDFLHHQASGQ